MTAISSIITPTEAIALTTVNLRCEHLENPLGIDATQPRLSWRVESLDRGSRQSAWQVLVSSDPKLLEQDKGDLWDSGKVEGDSTSLIPYQGKELNSRSRCYWKVRSWDKDGKASDWSTPATWTVGLTKRSDWSAKWIDGARIHRKSGDVKGMPVILSAAYEAVDGAGSLDATALLKKQASGTFSVAVGNDTLGGDPAYNHVKQLRVKYELDGKAGERVFPEKAEFHYPGDLGPPPIIRSAIYEAVDGAGYVEVTDALKKRAESGSFSINVGNPDLGSDPAQDHPKRLRVEFETATGKWTKNFAEHAAFSYPASLTAPATVPYLRKTFAVDKSVVRATVYATALGIYEMRLNGRRVGDHVLAPEWTDYSKRLNYQEYDVTDVLAQGANVLAAQVSNGWFAGHIGNGGYQYWGKVPALFAQLELTHADGTVERIVTDGSWKIHESPMLSTDFMMGEVYDATREIPGWDQPGFDDSKWASAIEREEAPRVMNGLVMEPVRKIAEIPAKSLTEPNPGCWTYDLGQNMVGVVRLKLRAAAGTRITLRHGEMLNPDGSLYTANLRGAPSIDTYICKGGEEETWEPKFTFHGFRYVELTGITEKPPLQAVTGIVIASDTTQTGKFACSDGQVNQLQSNIEWGQRGNYLSVPTDCPQRDERLGWMGDAQVFVKTATYNADVAAFFSKWLVDVTDSQGTDGRFADVSPFAGPSHGTPAWGDAGVICPWTLYEAYGDRELLERQFPSMVEWVNYTASCSPNFIRSGNRGSDYGDWLSIQADTDKELIGTAYYAYSTSLVAKAARVLGKSAEAEKHQQLFQQIKQAFIQKYVSADGRITSNTQCAYAMALSFDLLPTELREKAADYLEKDIIAKGYHLSTGFVGVSYLLPELTKAGKIDTAYRLLTQDSFPSWLFSVKMGATTIWERWDGWTPDKGFQDIGMNSFNHYSLGSCGEWLYRTVAGIDCDPNQPAFKKIIIRPISGGSITEADGEFRSVHGLITSAWSTANGNFTLTTTIPANTTAEIHVPAKDPNAITESGKPIAAADGVTFLRMEKEAAVFSVGSGRYQFVANQNPVSGNDSIERAAGAAVEISIQKMLSNDGQDHAFRSVSPLSVHGATLTVRDGSIVYQPREGGPASDRFTYTLRNSKGGIATRTVNVVTAASDKPDQARN
ncbi:MAG: family 78 glycoside hydrolase catalytic domain [Verrucomicrobiota bacterium]